MVSLPQTLLSRVFLASIEQHIQFFPFGHVQGNFHAFKVLPSCFHLLFRFGQVSSFFSSIARDSLIYFANFNTFSLNQSHHHLLQTFLSYPTFKPTSFYLHDTNLFLNTSKTLYLRFFFSLSDQFNYELFPLLKSLELFDISISLDFHKFLNKLIQLEHLLCEFSRFYSTELLSFPQLLHLQSLELRHCTCEVLDLSMLSRLLSFTLSDSKVTRIAGFSHLFKLQTLVIKHVPTLMSFSEEILSSCCLFTLRFDDDRVTSQFFSTVCFDMLTRFSIVNIDSDETMLRYFDRLNQTNIVELELYNGHVSHLDFSVFSSLERLTVSSLSSLEEINLSNLSKLKFLAIKNCPSLIEVTTDKLNVEVLDLERLVSRISLQLIQASPFVHRLVLHDFFLNADSLTHKYIYDFSLSCSSCRVVNSFPSFPRIRKLCISELNNGHDPVLNLSQFVSLFYLEVCDSSSVFNITLAHNNILQTVKCVNLNELTSLSFLDSCFRLCFLVVKNCPLAFNYSFLMNIKTLKCAIVEADASLEGQLSRLKEDLLPRLLCHTAVEVEDEDDF
ncbi:hypothetical protein RCL1_003661 [Eukaryota sp. TZLM3-RCL]